MEEAIAIVIILGIIVLICIWKQKKSPTFEQEMCKHDWNIIADSRRADQVIIYCPKCKLEKRLTRIKWTEMQIDMKYEEKENNIDG